MAVTDQTVLARLVAHWNTEKISGKAKSFLEIERFEKDNKVKLPSEFREYFTIVNGMENLYPNYSDSEGFLFYPLEHLKTYENELRSPLPKMYGGVADPYCVIFADYLQKSWWYGMVLEHASNSYSIVIIPSAGNYKILSNSFFEFLNMYIDDSAKLYDY
jgi:hypothetical protein